MSNKIINCEWCGKEYKEKETRKRFCSQECRKNYIVATYAEYEKTHPEEMEENKKAQQKRIKNKNG